MPKKDRDNKYKSNAISHSTNGLKTFLMKIELIQNSAGDILVMDDYGYAYFKDRTGDTFRWKGLN
jgi:hypothetical protein